MRAKHKSFVRYSHSISDRQYVIKIGDQCWKNCPGAYIPWKDLLEDTGVDHNWARVYYAGVRRRTPIIALELRIPPQPQVNPEPQGDPQPQVNPEPQGDPQPQDLLGTDYDSSDWLNYLPDYDWSDL
jgi:hypothetical protein